MFIILMTTHFIIQLVLPLFHGEQGAINLELLSFSKDCLTVYHRELSGRVLDSRPRGRGFERHCVVSLSKNINPSLVLVPPRKTVPL